MLDKTTVYGRPPQSAKGKNQPTQRGSELVARYNRPVWACNDQGVNRPTVWSNILPVELTWFWCPQLNLNAPIRQILSCELKTAVRGSEQRAATLRSARQPV